jgi:hypothetical protein
MLFIQHFSTFIFPFLVFGSTALGGISKGVIVEPGRMYLAKPHFILPVSAQEVCVFSVIMENRDSTVKPGLQCHDRCTMIALGTPNPANGLVHVAILTDTEHPNGGTKKQSEYGIPGIGQHVLQSCSQVNQVNLEHIPIDGNIWWHNKKTFQMDSTTLRKLITDTGACSTWW